MKVQFAVTPVDIAEGLPERACHCPIALAVKRKLGKTVFVGADDLDLWWGDTTVSRDLPPEAREFVSKFDKGEPVGPFMFELDLPD